MKPRHSLLPLAVMVIATTGCFETQRDETFADTVVHDDTEIRVLHASPDAPRLDLLLDGERRLEDLDYGQTRVLTPPADWYDVTLEGRVGQDTEQTLLKDGFDRFDEDRRYDLLVAGSADEGDDTLRTVLLVWDEQEDSEDGDEDGGDESLSLRGVHLVESEDDLGELDVFINGDHDEPLTTLDYGEGSESLALDEAVVRIRLQKPDGDEPLFDSGKRERVPAGEELLVAVVPNTSASADQDGGSPVKVLILNGDEVTTLRNEAEQSSLRFVHAASGSGDLDVVEVKPSGGQTVWEAEESPEYEEVLPSADPADFVFLDSGAHVVEVGQGDNGEAQSRDARWHRGHGRTILALNDADSDLDLKTALNNDRTVATNARVRLFHGSPNVASGSDGPGAIDVYLLQEDDDLAQEQGVVDTPVFSSLSFRKMSRYEPVPNGDYDLVVTRAGDTSDELIRQESVTLSNHGIYDLVFAGEGESNGEGYDFQLIQIGGVPGS